MLSGISGEQQMAKKVLEQEQKGREGKRAFGTSVYGNGIISQGNGSPLVFPTVNKGPASSLQPCPAWSGQQGASDHIGCRIRLPWCRLCCCCTVCLDDSPNRLPSARLPLSPATRLPLCCLDAMTLPHIFVCAHHKWLGGKPSWHSGGEIHGGHPASLPAPSLAGFSLSPAEPIWVAPGCASLKVRDNACHGPAPRSVSRDEGLPDALPLPLSPDGCCWHRAGHRGVLSF